MLKGVAKIIYDSILSKETLEEQQTEYIRLMSVKTYKKLYKTKVDNELIVNGYKDVIVDLDIQSNQNNQNIQDNQEEQQIRQTEP